MARIAITYSPEVGGSSVISIKNAFIDAGGTIYDADFRAMMRDIPDETFATLYDSPEGRIHLFAHAKVKAREILDHVDCLEISGNTDFVDPRLYHEDRQSGRIYDFSRTIAELALLHEALQRGMPILGICGGHQLFSVYFGGTLQDLSPEELSKQTYFNYDTVHINTNTLLAKILSHSTAGGLKLGNPKNRPMIQAELFGAHIQRIGQTADSSGLLISATASDKKAIEALEASFGPPMLSTQFHPEVSILGFPNSKDLYKDQNPDARARCKKLFEFFNAAGDAYAAKQKMVHELRKCHSSQNNSLLFKPTISEKKLTIRQVKQSKNEVIPWKKIALILIGAWFIGMLAVFMPTTTLATLNTSALFAMGFTTGGLITTSAVFIKPIMKNIGTAFERLGNFLAGYSKRLANFFRGCVSKITTSRMMFIIKRKASNAKQPEGLTDHSRSAPSISTSPMENSFDKVCRLLSLKPIAPNQILLNAPAASFCALADQTECQPEKQDKTTPSITPVP